MMTLESLQQWNSTVTSALVIAVGTALINRSMKRSERKADERHEEAERKRAQEDAWREGVSARIGRLEGVIESIVSLQCSQARSDVLHKCHRYIDDIGAASIAEKQSLMSENADYKAVCDAHGIRNHYIDMLVDKVMELPERDV